MKENKNLHNAKVAKDDEFYTLIEDIENECEKYKAQFEDKIIYCNCDDPIQSNFFKYFANSFKRLKLKKLICTCYDKGMSQKQDLWWNTYENDLGITVSPKRAYKIVIDEAIDYNNDGAFNWDDVASLIKNDIETNSFKYVSYLNEDGDFRSAECVELLKEADIIVTNPPFSLFREFIALLEKYNKKYLIIGNKNAITYKETFALIKANKLWFGYNNVSTFVKPDGTEKKFGNIGWFTNLDTYIRHTELDLYKKYNEADYPKYDNYDAINVDRVADIPCDYFGVMGVPITFLDKYNPEQFDIVSFRKGEDGKDLVFTTEREREFNRTFVSLFNADPRLDEQSKRYKSEWEIYLRQNNNQAKIEPIDYFYPVSTNLSNTLVNDCTVNGKKTYVRMLIQRVKTKEQDQ